MEVNRLRASYDAAAKAYVDHVYHELEHKPLDRHLLNRFAEDVRDRGPVADIGCGPGHVARYLHDQGVTVTGMDLSPGMVAQATELNPGIAFRVGDMRALDFADASLAGIVAFYSIIHLDPVDLAVAFREFHRVLMAGGALLIAFHAGDDTLHVDDLWGVPVSLDFHFLQPDSVKASLLAAGLTVTESVERAPYDGVEYPSRRSYLFARGVMT